MTDFFRYVSDIKGRVVITSPFGHTVKLFGCLRPHHLVRLDRDEIEVINHGLRSLQSDVRHVSSLESCGVGEGLTLRFERHLEGFLSLSRVCSSMVLELSILVGFESRLERKIGECLASMRSIRNMDSDF